LTFANEHLLSYRKLLGVLGILFLLTVVTILVSRIDLGWLNIWIALMVASIKSSFVLMYFMHLKYESKLFLLTFTITVFIVAILISFMFWDISFRPVTSFMDINRGVHVSYC